MTRSTKDPRLAMERLAEAVGAELERAGPRAYRVVIPVHADVHRSEPRSAKRTLAHLIFFARVELGWSQEKVQETIRLRRVTPRGLPGHEFSRIREHITRRTS